MNFVGENNIDLLIVLPKRHGLIDKIIHKITTCKVYTFYGQNYFVKYDPKVYTCLWSKLFRKITTRKVYACLRLKLFCKIMIRKVYACLQQRYFIIL